MINQYFNRISIKYHMLVRFILFELIALAILNWVWLVYRFDKSPLYNIDGIVLLNFLLSIYVAKKIPLASAFLTGMGIILILLGFVFIRGLLTFTG